MYLGVAYITHATQGFYTYSFLDPQKEHGLLAAYIVGIAVGECIVFAIIWGLCWSRERIANHFGRGVGSERPEALGMREEIDEWEEIDREELGVGGGAGRDRAPEMMEIP